MTTSHTQAWHHQISNSRHDRGEIRTPVVATTIYLAICSSLLLSGEICVTGAIRVEKILVLGDSKEGGGEPELVRVQVVADHKGTSARESSGAPQSIRVS